MHYVLLLHCTVCSVALITHSVMLVSWCMKALCALYRRLKQEQCQSTTNFEVKLSVTNASRLASSMEGAKAHIKRVQEKRCAKEPNVHISTMVSL